METCNLKDTQFKTLIIMMLSELGERINELSENFHKKIGNKSQSEMKKTKTEMKTSLDINIRLYETEE